MNIGIFTDAWAKGFLEYFGNRLRTIKTDAVFHFEPPKGPMPLSDELAVAEMPLDVRKVGQYDLAVYHHDSKKLFNSMVPGDTALTPEIRLTSYLNHVASEFRKWLGQNRIQAVIVFQPIKADRIIAVTMARALHIPVISINPEPFPGFFWLDNGAPQHTGRIASTDMWHRIRRAKFYPHEHNAFNAWITDFKNGKRTRGQDWLDNEAGHPVLSVPSVLIIGQMKTDANQFSYQLGIDYCPEVLAHHILKEFPNANILYKPHPLEREQDKIQWPAEVKVLPGKSNLHDYFSSPNLWHVFVWNSNAGIEALAYEKPVCVLGEAFYRGKGFTFDMSRPSDFESIPHFLEWNPNPEDIRQYLRFIVTRFLVKSDDTNAIRNRIDAIVNQEEWYGI